MKQEYNLHVFPVRCPDGISRKDYLYELIMDGAKERYVPLTTNVLERIEHEWAVISLREEHIDYLLLIKDIVDYIRLLLGFVGPGRGSSAGSIVNYCLGITKVDPLEYGLLYERFLINKELTPIIDLDIDYITYENICRFRLHYGREHMQRIVNADKSGIHPTMFIIAKENIDSDEVIPHIVINKERVIDVNCIDFRDNDKRGLYVNLIPNEHLNSLRGFDWSKISLDDSNALRTICKIGNNNFGVSKSLNKYIVRLNKLSIKSLSDLSALIYHGEDKIEEYIVRQNETSECVHNGTVAEILSETHGIIIYQEQIIEILKHVADLTFHEARKIQTQLARKNNMSDWKNIFIDRGIAKGYEKIYLEELWCHFIKFAPYCFMKSHTISYAIMAYWKNCNRLHHYTSPRTDDTETQWKEKRYLSAPKVIVAGSRTFNNYSYLEEKLNLLFSDTYAEESPSFFAYKAKPTIISGMAKGADSLAIQFADEYGYTKILMPANWQFDEVRAGFFRNKAMLSIADALVAFWDGKSTGTKHMIDIAREKGIPIWIFRYNKIK